MRTLLSFLIVFACGFSTFAQSQTNFYLSFPTNDNSTSYDQISIPGVGTLDIWVTYYNYGQDVQITPNFLDNCGTYEVEYFNQSSPGEILYPEALIDMKTLSLNETYECHANQLVYLPYFKIKIDKCFSPTRTIFLMHNLEPSL
ncbi:hypothetical protein FUAX_07400 [Fulvitalea axinellae]|uniref:Uncharacterized protein n=1 Tax=Fulvitalea axinellae TaxID=1182444 RepID=A0AAU9CEN7_9BACT|nr:hypothetical protein FUAX_07400 [Fulvitalea axinellae]